MVCLSRSIACFRPFKPPLASFRKSSPLARVLDKSARAEMAQEVVLEMLPRNLYCLLQTLRLACSLISSPKLHRDLRNAYDMPIDVL